MGEARRKQIGNREFLRLHRVCCLCGGESEATTVEHAPPKVFFINKEVPGATHRVPSCARCNNGSSQADQVAALAALTQASVHRDIPADYFEKVLKGVKNNAPEAFLAIANGRSGDEKLRVNGVVGTYAKVEVDGVIFDRWLNPWAAKQAYALYYLESGKILAPSAAVVVRWFSNADIAEGNAPEKLTKSLLNYGELKQGSRTSGLQYSYKWQIEPGVSCFILLLQDASLVFLGIFDHLDEEKKFEDWPVFQTNAAIGIHRV